MTTTSKRTLGRTSLAMFGALALLFLTLTPNAHAQSAYHVGGKSNVVTLYGSSTLHDWNMTAHSFSTDGQFTVTGENELSACQALSFTLPVHNLKSDHDGLNDNAYESLKADKYKDIVFKASSAKVSSLGGHKYQIAASGNLTIAGVTRPTTVTATAVVNSDGSISCSGSVPLKLSEFNIDRPSFMFGTMKVGDALTLNYALMFVK